MKSTIIDEIFHTCSILMISDKLYNDLNRMDEKIYENIMENCDRIKKNIKDMYKSYFASKEILRNNVEIDRDIKYQFTMFTNNILTDTGEFSHPGIKHMFQVIDICEQQILWLFSMDV